MDTKSMASKDVWVSWYTCDCDYISKYCDDYHRVGALVPVSVLEPYYVEGVDYGE